MVPLTNSLYVPGRLADVDEVLVDIGTGYYAKKSIASAQDFMERKVYIKYVDVFCYGWDRCPIKGWTATRALL
jgi:hypothetical protein